MKFRDKETGKIQTCDMVVITDEPIDGEIASLNKHTFIFRSVEQFNDNCEPYKPIEPLIKDEKIRKAVRAWAEANEVVKAFVVMNGRMNWTIHGDDVDRNRFRIEFFDRVVSENDETKNYTIAELCGEDEAPEPIEPTFIDLDERIKEKEI